jgi:hypothetical protein
MWTIHEETQSELNMHHLNHLGCLVKVVIPSEWRRISEDLRGGPLASTQPACGMYACIHVCISRMCTVCMRYACMHVCMYVSQMHSHTGVRIGMYACMYVCIYRQTTLRPYVCMYVCMHACNHVGTADIDHVARCEADWPLTRSQRSRLTAHVITAAAWFSLTPFPWQGQR